MIRLFKHFVPVQIVLLLLADALILVAAVYLGISARLTIGSWDSLEYMGPIFPKAIAYMLVTIATMSALGMYQRDVVRSHWGYYLKLLISFALSTAIMTVVFYVFTGLVLGRGAFAMTVLFSLLGVVLARGIFVRLVNHDVLKKRILVLGTGTRAARIEEMLREEALAHKFHLIGYLACGGNSHSVDSGKIIAQVRPLLGTAIHVGADELIVGVRDRRGGALPMDQLLECKLEGINVIDISSFFERESGHVQIDSLNPSWMVFSDGFCRNSARSIIKRSFDILVSLALLAVTFPVMVITAIAILLETGWPILYRQTRVGECGHPFEVFKFRSMRVDAEKDGIARWATANDDRVTKVGRFIRQTRIDELPQIFNVLRGDMSFVGPRPERPQFVSQLDQQVRYYSSRHAVKPGITGWAQIRYPYGASTEDAEKKLQYDLYYVKNHSLFLDLIILFRTAEVVLFGRGAR